jgi:hypothetical protein
LTFQFLNKKDAMNGARFETASAIQGTVTRELYAEQEESFPEAFDSLHMQGRIWTILSDGINSFCLVYVAFYGLSLGANFHTNTVSSVLCPCYGMAKYYEPVTEIS